MNKKKIKKTQISGGTLKGTTTAYAGFHDQILK